MSFRSACYLLSLAAIALDLGTKALASRHLTYGEPVVLTSWFNLTLLHNRGAAFSFLGGAGGWQRWLFIALAASVSVALALWLRHAQRTRWTLFTGLALVLGGAAGNLVDRVRLGYVVDFIQWHLGDWYYPAFNIADSAITLGAVLLIIDTLKPQGSD